MINKFLVPLLFLYRSSDGLLYNQVKSSDIILLFLVILVSGSIINLAAPILISSTFGLLFFVAILIFKTRKFNIFSFKNLVGILLIIVFLFLGKFILSTEIQTFFKYAFFFINALISMLVLLYFESAKRSILSTLYIVLYFYMIHAFASFVAWFFIKNNLSVAPLFNNYTFYHIFYYSLSELDVINQLRTIEIAGVSFFRTSGLFWEPGILQWYMNILLFLSLFIYKNIKIAILTSFVILTTWSTTGIIIFSFQLLYYFLIANDKNKLIKIALVPLLLIMIFPTVKDNIYNKFYGSHAGSGFARTLDTFTAINIIKNNFLIGIPLDSSSYKNALHKYRANLDMQSARLERDAANTNSILNYFVFFGIPIGSLLLYSFFRQAIVRKYRTLFFTIIFIGLLSEPIGFFIFPLMVLFSKYIVRQR